MKEDLATIKLAGMRQYGFGPMAMKQLKICPVCGEPSFAGHCYCTGCGAALPNETLYQSYKRRKTACPVCDTILPEQTRYCPKCGTKLNRQQGGNGHGVF